MTTDDLITVTAAARSAGVPPNRIRRWISRGYLPAQQDAAGPGKTGRPGYLVSRADLAQCLEQAEVNAQLRDTEPTTPATWPGGVWMTGHATCPWCHATVPPGQGYCGQCQRLTV